MRMTGLLAREHDNLGMTRSFKQPPEPSICGFKGLSDTPREYNPSTLWWAGPEQIPSVYSTPDYRPHQKIVLSLIIQFASSTTIKNIRVYFSLSIEASALSFDYIVILSANSNACSLVLYAAILPSSPSLTPM